MPRHFHTISQADAETMAATRTFLKSMPGLALAPETRPFFDDMIAQTPLADGVDYEADTVGGVPGWWCRPKNTPTHGVILYLHGGGYVMGSASAYRNPVGHIAAKAGFSAFALDYRLAPEHPFPAAFNDAVAAYDSLVGQGFTHIAIAGDSAGGGLTLALTAFVCIERKVKPLAAVVISPWTDMMGSGESYSSRAAADSMLDRIKMMTCADQYLAGAKPNDPRASPVFGGFTGLPPILIHVGDDEVLLDDSTRYAEQVEHGGGSVELHIWEGMLHVFTSGIATLDAAREAMRGIGIFLTNKLQNVDA